MITIFSPHITSRLRYVLEFCFTQKGESYHLVETEEVWNNLAQKDLNYSSISLIATHTIQPQGLLFESQVENDRNLVFKDGKPLLDDVYDPLSLIFYWLTRYEEYVDGSYDQHGRRPSANNSLVKLNLHKTVIVDHMVKLLWNKLNLDYTKVQEEFTLIPSFDIDVAWAYKNRKFLRTLGAFVKGGNPLERIRVLAGMQKDPYDTYGDIRRIAVETGNFLAFILLGDWNKYDKNIHWENLSYGSLIRGLNLEGEIGIHPSYASHLNGDQIKVEINRLETITGHEITMSRQHFLRFQVPETYRLLHEIGIKNDYSMGFADEIGFRAGTSFPFYYFDLHSNMQTDLMIHPFAYMDSSLKDYLKLNPAQAIIEVEKLIKQVKSVGGEFIMIWHNSSIHDRDEWNGWKQVLDFTISEGLKKTKS